MSDLISREALLKKMTIRLDDLRRQYGLFDHYTDGFDDAIDMVDFSQTVEAEPVRHGRWIDHPDDSCSLFNGWECSECEQIVSGGRGNYCPNCGAKMDRGAGE